eukprot:3467968-Prymnesium_polylepis.1
MPPLTDHALAQRKTAVSALMQDAQVDKRHWHPVCRPASLREASLREADAALRTIVTQAHLSSTTSSVVEYALYLGMRLPEDAHLLHWAERGHGAVLPEGW